MIHSAISLVLEVAPIVTRAHGGSCMYTYVIITPEAEPDSDNLRQPPSPSAILGPLGGPQNPSVRATSELRDLLVRASGLACGDVAQYG